MTVKTFTLVANTPQVALTGRYIIRNVTFEANAAGTLSLYDGSVGSITQSNPAYVDGSVNCSYTRTVTGVRDLACGTDSYDYAGISTTYPTTAANASFALPAIMALGIGSSGTVGPLDAQAVVARGLVLNSTAAGFAVVQYDVAV